jgi:hypothetical protein
MFQRLWRVYYHTLSAPTIPKPSDSMWEHVVDNQRAI